MKIYVATAFTNKEAASKAMAVLRNAGHDIAYDWTCYQSDVPIGRRAEAERCKRAVIESEVFVIIGDCDCRGALFEFGMAISLNKTCFVIGHLPSIFDECYGFQRVETVEDVVKFLDSDVDFYWGNR